MHTAVIIDDEDSLISGIRANLNWTDIDVDLVGTARDGDEGLELIYKEKPDIVISDIRMPTMDGLEMCRILQKSQIFPQIIFISGYDDHDYARSALKLAAVDYILKPFNPKELERTLKVCVENIHQQRTETARSGRHAARSALSNVLTSNSMELTEDQHNAIIAACRLKRGSSIALMVIQLDRYPDMDEVLDEATLFEDCRQYVRSNPRFNARTSRIVVDIGRQDRVAILFNCANPEVLIDDCRRYTASIRDELTRKYGRSTFFGLSEVECNVSRIPIMFLHAKKAMHLGFFDRDYYTHDYKELKNAKSDIETSVIRDRIVNLISILDFPACREELASLFVFYTARVDNVFPELKLECIRICNQVENSLVDQNSVLYAGAIREAELIIIASSGFREVHDTMVDLVNTLTSGQSEDDQRVELRLRAAIEYINEHLSEPITLSDVADTVFYSASRFSVRFSQMVGQPFSRYLAFRRIEKAREIFQNEPYLRVYEVAEKVGYTNAQYFSTLFKKTVGVSPLQYVASKH